MTTSGTSPGTARRRPRPSEGGRLLPPLRLDLTPPSIVMPAFLESPNATAARLLDAALELFARKGYETTSMDDIADPVGITKGSLYHYVSGKQELLSAVLIVAFAKQQRVAALVNEKSAFGLAAVRCFVTGWLDYHLLDPRPSIVLERDWRSLASAEREFWTNNTQLNLDFLHGAIAEGQRLGEIDGHVHAGLAAMATYGMLTWTPSWYRPGTSLDRRKVRQTYEDFVLHGLLPRLTPQSSGGIGGTQSR